MKYGSHRHYNKLTDHAGHVNKEESDFLDLRDTGFFSSSSSRSKSTVRIGGTAVLLEEDEGSSRGDLNRLMDDLHDVNDMPTMAEDGTAAEKKKKLESFGKTLQRVT